MRDYGLWEWAPERALHLFIGARPYRAPYGRLLTVKIIYNRNYHQRLENWKTSRRCTWRHDTETDQIRPYFVLCKVQLWVFWAEKAMGYGVSETYGISSLSQLGKAENLWVMRDYGLWGAMGYEGLDCMHVYRASS